MRASAVFFLTAISMLATGCVAAALPIAAGMATLHSERVQEGKRDKAASPPTPPFAATVDAPKSASAPQTSAIVATTLTALPPPDLVSHAGVGIPFALRSYVGKQAGLPAAGASRRTSALLAKPGDLTSTRADCRAASSAVFIDLDPGRGTFDPLSPGQPDGDLAGVLASLRGQGVSVVWFSRLGENFDADVRGALAASRLDPDRRDQVVLMRTIEERKQTRREALADFLCPVALVGDEHADFDELYLYLRNKDAAVALEPLIGEGWFIISPFQPIATGAQL